MKCRECKRYADVRVYGLEWDASQLTLDGQIFRRFTTFDFCNLHFTRYLKGYIT